jgi:sigma-B regulation protein RsbU (phosphoserine phosphatase)
MRSLFSKPVVPAVQQQPPAPAVIPEIRGAQFACVYHGHRIAGDFYDIVRVNPARIVFGLLDVAGLREDAFEISSRAQEVFRAEAARLFAPDDINEADAMVELTLEVNRAIMQAANGVRHCPAFAGCYNEVLGTVCYSNAGHVPGLVRDQTGISELPATGLPLGLFSHATHDAPTCALEPGAALLLVSIGVIEGRCKHDEFGLERVKNILLQSPLTDAHGLCASVLDGVEQFMCAPPTHDDVTALALIRRPAKD